MKRTLALLCVMSLFVAIGSASMASQASPVKSFIVNTSTDAVDANPGDSLCATATGACSLRAAVQELNALGQAANNITVPSGTTTLTIAGAGEDSAATGDLDLKVNVVIGGSLGSSIVAAGAGLGDRLFDVPSGLAVNVTLKALAVQGGAAPGSENGGAVRYRGTGTLTLLQADFTDNAAVGGSGGGLSQTSGMLSANIVTFRGNSAARNGGGADIEGSTVTTLFTHLTFTSNTAFQGGGLAAFVAAGATGSVPLLDGSTFSTNASTTGGYGGGLAIARTTAVKIDILDNTASNGGGVELVGSTAPAALSGRIVISGNAAALNGGGIYSKNCGVSCSLLHVVLENNSAAKNGSAMYVFGGLTAEKMTLNANHTGGQGQYGGAVFHIGPPAGPLTFTNLTIGENTNGPVAGGVVIASKATDLFTNVSIANNMGGSYNGVAVTPGSKPPQVRNTIVSSTGASCSRPLQSLGHNLESGNTCGFNQGGDLINANAMLAALADNGGGTHTMKLLTGSPAIDSGDPVGCPIYDQRSVRRPYDGDGNGTATCDIGAYEVSGPLASLNNDIGFSSTVATVTGSSVTYAFTIKNTGEGAAANTLFTDMLPDSLDATACTASGVVCFLNGNTCVAIWESIPVGANQTVAISAKHPGCREDRQHRHRVVRQR